MRAILIEADACAPVTSIARACEIFGNKPVIASANTPAQRSFFIPMSPQQFEWVMAGRYLRIWPPKRTKCGQNVIFGLLHGTKCKVSERRTQLRSCGVHNM